MLRIGILRASSLARPALRSASRPSMMRFQPQPFVRFESDDAKAQRRAALDAKDDLQRDWDAKVLTYEELKPKTLQPTPDSYLIDVREPDEVLQGAIPSSVNLPLSTLASALHLGPDEFKATYGFDKPKPEQEVTFYCRSGKRSTSASDIAKRNGYKNILNYTGSWLDWVEREGKKSA